MALLVSLMYGCSSKTPRHSSAEYSSEPTLAPYEIKNITYYPIADAEDFRERGVASWYGDYFHGRKTANGEIYNMHAMTAAHKTLPMNTMLRVRNLDNGKEVTVRVNDRGPFIKGRIIDVSYKAAKKLNIVGPGTAKVEITSITPASLEPVDNKQSIEAIAKNSEKATNDKSLVPPQETGEEKSERQNQDAPNIEQEKQPVISLANSSPQNTQSPPALLDKRQLNTPEPSGQLTPVKSQLYYVQIGRFYELERALRLKKRFTAAGHAAVIDTQNNNGRQSFHVHVFAGRELASARKAEAELLSRGYTGAVVIIR